jgi:hypothetical protein
MSIKQQLIIEQHVYRKNKYDSRACEALVDLAPFKVYKFKELPAEKG